MKEKGNSVNDRGKFHRQRSPILIVNQKKKKKALQKAFSFENFSSTSMLTSQLQVLFGNSCKHRKSLFDLNFEQQKKDVETQKWNFVTIEGARGGKAFTLERK